MGKSIQALSFYRAILRKWNETLPLHSLSISMESTLDFCIEMQILLFAMSQLISTFSFYFEYCRYSSSIFENMIHYAVKRFYCRNIGMRNNVDIYWFKRCINANLCVKKWFEFYRRIVKIFCQTSHFVSLFF